MKPLIGITIGDINGIGPEVALKAATLPSVRALCSPVLIGPMSVFEGTAKHLKLRVKFEKANLVHLSKTAVAVVDVGDALWANVAWGSSTITSGKNAGVAIERAVQLCLEKKLSAFVTAPASKAALSLAGYGFPGQTEMIALLSGTRQVAMMLIAKDFRVGLVTAHTPVREIVQNITSEKIIEKVTIIRHALVRDFAVKNPRLAVLGLNPHAGENGLLGEEEQKFIVPALTTLREQSTEVSGPFPADGFFGSGQHKNYDAVVAMYHDQGLIPLKMKAFTSGVNYSAGLAIIRTSPDHGTAFDIAGKRKADARSTTAAIQLAVRIAKNRVVHDRA